MKNKRSIGSRYEHMAAAYLSEYGVVILEQGFRSRVGEIDLIGIANAVEEQLRQVEKPITVAVMGCIVNGPGEAAEADVGLAGGKGKVAIFKKGKVVRTVDEQYAVEELMKEIHNL